MDWISVDEKLPDKPMRCIVYRRGGLDISYWNEGFYAGKDVTHWMPAPEYPQNSTQD